MKAGKLGATVPMELRTSCSSCGCFKHAASVQFLWSWAIQSKESNTGGRAAWPFHLSRCAPLGGTSGRGAVSAVNPLAITSFSEYRKFHEPYCTSMTHRYNPTSPHHGTSPCQPPHAAHQVHPEVPACPALSSMEHRASSIQNPASRIQHPASSIQHPASRMKL
jgi:hypothetical protein